MKFRYLVFGALALGTFLIAFIFWGRHGEADVFPLVRQFDVTYAAKIDLPKDTKWVRIWIPLASDRDGQRILERKIEAPGPYRITKELLFGNEMLYFESNGTLPRNPVFRIGYKVQVAKKDFSHLKEDRNLSAYLQPTRLMAVTEEVQNRVLAATQNASTGEEKAKRIYEDVIRRMVYDKTVPGYGEGDTIRACLVGKGNCTDFHSLFISMAQAAQIPARFKIGLTIPSESKGEIPGYHCWAEFYENQKGWRPVDASEAWKHPEKKEAYFGNFDTNKFLLSVGRDVALEPRQSGAPVNIFFYPHVEADGKESTGVTTSFYYKNV